MSVYLLDKRLLFPPVSEADQEGLLAVGGDLSTERLLLAYRSGIFPWYSGRTPQWYSPDPRFVLIPDELKVSHSMKPLLKKKAFEFTTNTAFAEVIQNCKTQPREGQFGTWITDDMKAAYIRLHQQGFAHSAEVWQEGKLVGGLYGVKIGRVFFGESMFSLVSNASKYAFISYVQQLKEEGIQLIDCQVYTPHLESLGAIMISREEFVEVVRMLTRGA